MKNTVYIAGPISGLPGNNYAAFHAEAARLRKLGWTVENPAEGPECDSWEAYMRNAIAQLIRCDVIALLPGWASSTGACVERDLAETLRMDITQAELLGAP